MKQILQNLNTGTTEMVDVPVPTVMPGWVLIRTSRSLVSAGTERMLVDFGKAGWIEKARQQPEKVRQVLDKIRTDGVIPTVEAVFNKLDEPMALGYCNAGVVISDCHPEPVEGQAMVRQAHHDTQGQAQGDTDIKIGDRVASNGPHAEVVCVPRNLCAKIPDGVSDDEAVFTVLGSIALQGVRLAAPTLGERFIVFGLGLVGLLTVQLLRANGCTVLAVDANEKRLRLAKAFGAETIDLGKGTDPVAVGLAWTGGRGVDGQRSKVAKVRLTIPSAQGGHAVAVTAWFPSAGVAVPPRSGDFFPRTGYPATNTADYQETRKLLKRVVLAGKESVSVDIPIAFNDPLGEYEISVTELFTNRTVTKKWTVQ